MTCIMTLLTVLSVFNGSVWNDVEVTTKSKVVAEQNPYVMLKVEVVNDNTLLSKTVSVQCGEDIEANTNSYLKTK